MAETNNQDNKSVDMRSIKELNGCHFVIPSYQRGYRWDEIQVKDLLNDIYEFKQNNNEGFYCLQPLVLKEISDEEVLKELNITNKNNIYEVIDGQQRLTTIYLILKYLKSKNIIEENIYTITYSTREDSKKFLEENLVYKELSEEEKKEYITHIDFEYMYEAYKIINEWFNTDEKEKEIKDILLPNKTDKKSVKFIWYEPTDKNHIEIFTRINIGKIPLTNSELIKALFLQKANFKYDDKKDNDKFDKDLYEHTQIEIASEWDYIENTLQNNRFWGFINNDINQKYNRIDYIFEIVSDKEISEEDKKEIGADKYKTFRYFYKKWKNNDDKMSFMKDTWKEIRYCFYAMNKWYNDLTLYHYIGYIIYWSKDTKADIIKLYNLYKKSKKTDFDYEVCNIIKSMLKNIKFYDYINDKKECSIYYDNKSRDIIRKLLLLYNIEYMLKNKSSYSKFPFNLFKEENWDIEHIEPKTPQTEDELEKYIKNILENKYVKNELNIFNKELKNIEESKEKDKNKKLDDLYEKIKKIFFKDEKFMIDEDSKDSLSNLVLLDSKTNKEYHNSFFAIKRKIIIYKDKYKEKNSFIPICTKYVFLKYFDENIETSSIHQWTKYDADKYEKDIYKKLEKFLSNNQGE